MGRLIPLPSNESDGSKQYWTKSENEKYTPRDTYYHEKLLLSCAEDLNLGGVCEYDFVITWFFYYSYILCLYILCGFLFIRDQHYMYMNRFTGLLDRGT